MGERDDAKKSEESSGATIRELVVGLGASAGGIPALKEFFSHDSNISGVAYVVILHLSPTHESHLAEVLQAASQLPVTQARGRVPLLPDHVYVIPPGANLELTDAHLLVSAMTTA